MQIEFNIKYHDTGLHTLMVTYSSPEVPGFSMDQLFPIPLVGEGLMQGQALTDAILAAAPVWALKRRGEIADAQPVSVPATGAGDVPEPPPVKRASVEEL
jgi:hypothetical protein